MEPYKDSTTNLVICFNLHAVNSTTQTISQNLFMIKINKIEFVNSIMQLLIRIYYFKFQFLVLEIIFEKAFKTCDSLIFNGGHKKLLERDSSDK